MRKIILGFLKKAVFFLFVLSLSAIFVELSLRLYNPFKFRVKGGEIILPANERYIINNTAIDKLDKEIIHTRNSLGFRGPEPPENFDDFLSIIVVGGSSAECSYISDTKTWPYLLGQNLQQSCDNIWLNNAGLDGHATFGHIILLRNYLVKLRPKIILFLVGANDRAKADLSIYDKMPLANSYNSLSDYLEKKSELVSLLSNFKRRLNAVRSGIVHEHLDLSKAESLEIPQEKIKQEVLRHKLEYVEGYRQRLEELISICRQNDIEPIFITQPSLAGKAVDPVSGVNLATLKMWGNRNGELLWSVLCLYNSTTIDVCESLGVFVIDLAAKLPKSSLYFYDRLHYTNSGCREVAQLVYEGLKEYLDIKYPEFVRK
ncbi:MAG: SGNH/GDSL hydrolase family protein [Candidatus Omnitrophica bacterium]|nr:SGNH/GDSL hydrolase family protein [Candidatus Omnitrophota bacterium]